MKERNRATAGQRGKGSGGRHAYEVIRTRIISLELAPGETLEEARLVGELGLSRTPVREAVIRLASEGLVELAPNRSARVTPMSIAFIREHLEAYDLIQRTATRWCAARRSDAELSRIMRHRDEFEAAAAAHDPVRMEQANRQFHSAIGAACGNVNIRRFYEQLLIDSSRIAQLAMTSGSYSSPDKFHSHLGTILEDHRRITRAIADRDGDAAEAVAHSHAELGRRRIIAYFEQNAARDIVLTTGVPG